MSKLKLNFKVFDPRQVSEYGMGEKHARRLVSFGFINKLCDASDVIVIADTMPDGRAILVSLTAVQEKLRCKSQIVVELTNRFDWLVYDSEKYYKMLKRLIEKPPPNLHWTQNNPFEEVYFKMRVGVSPKKMRLLRSMGGVNVRYDDNNNTAAIETPEMAERLALIKDLQETYKPKIGDVLDYLCMPHAKLPKKYGGPEALLKYKGFIEFPYQVSVMKFYENVANGVPQVIPSARLMKGVVQSNNHHYFDCWLAALEEGSLMLSNPDRFLKEKKKDIGFHGVDRSYNASWIELSDFYSTEFQPFVYYFDSFRELGDLINKPASQFDVKNVRVEGPKFYEKVRQQTLTTWETLFHEINFTHVRLK
ncbi:hypothetical protein BC830DRAFT_577257 [Chytriomyces sp. MP71]|nr:hypothetical protein BC830DRAFT_577257 [Chytriomyces sp. MP71]